jgi:hypothetical protein
MIQMVKMGACAFGLLRGLQAKAGRICHQIWRHTFHDQGNEAIIHINGRRSVEIILQNS